MLSEIMFAVKQMKTEKLVMTCQQANNNAAAMHGSSWCQWSNPPLLAHQLGLAISAQVRTSVEPQAQTVNQKQ